jgi:hypothetical protein
MHVLAAWPASLFPNMLKEKKKKRKEKVNFLNQQIAQRKEIPSFLVLVFFFSFGKIIYNYYH